MTMILVRNTSSLIRLWWTSIRPFSLGTSLLAVLFGVSLARQTGLTLRGTVLALTLLIALLIHVVTNLTNSLYDWISGHDKATSPQAIPILRDNPQGVKLVKQAISLLSLVIAIASLVFAYLTSWPMLLWPITGYLGGIYYTKPPLAYKHKGISLPAVFVLMGMMLPMVSFVAQTSYVSKELIVFCLPVALLVAAILGANELRDRGVDAAAGSITFTVLFGDRFCGALYYALLTLPYLFIAISVLWFSLAPASLTVFLTLPLVPSLTRKVQEQEFRGLDVATAQFHGLFCFIYILSLYF